MFYRPDIDGLRAIAVLSVLLFHGGISAFSGGFIGVDIFFVISGYLITSSILEQKKRNTFSIINFYERRARRILPALFLIMLISIPFAYFTLLPKELRDFFQSITATSTFVSNIFFWKETGYFETASELKPFLHTWSLAVEEQYYIFFPIFIGVFWNKGWRWLFNSLLAISAFSLIAAQISSHYTPSASFFLLHTRLWEILAGGLIPLYSFKKPQRKPSPNTFLSFVGLFLICFAILYFTPNTPFPSFYALIPIIGTCLVILYSDTNNATGKLLGNKVFVGIGLISYSLYLWHQPVFSLTKQYYNITTLTPLLFVVLSAVCIFLSYFSWKYVETPFRDKNIFNQKQIFRYSIIGLIFFLAIGITGDVSKGFKNRITQNGVSFAELEKKLRPNHGLSHFCEGEFQLNEKCRTSEQPDILIWGDSYAMHLTNGILSANPDSKVIQFTKSSCGPILDIAPITDKYNKVWADGCQKFNNQVIEWLRAQDNIKYAVLSSPFAQYLDQKNKILIDDTVTDTDTKTVSKKFRHTLETLISLGIKPIVFSPPPTNGHNLGRCLAQRQAQGKNLAQCNFARHHIKNVDVFEFLKQFENAYDIVMFDELMCSDGTCHTHQDDIFLYRDSGHFSNEGTLELGKKVNYYDIITQH